MKKQKRKMSLQTILLMLNLIILLFPIFSIHFLKLYENELIRQTESELISQAAFLAAIYKKQVLDSMDRQIALQYYGIQIDSPIPEKDYYKPIPAKLDLAKDKVFEPITPSAGIKIEADPTALRAGQMVYPILREAQRTTLADIKILDPDGVAVVSQKNYLKSFAFVPEVQSAMQGIPMSVLRQKDIQDNSQPFDSLVKGSNIDIYVALPVMEANNLLGVVWVRRTPKNLLSSLYSKRKDILQVITIALILILLSATLASLTITKPVKRLIEQIDKFMQGDKNADFVIKEPYTDEICKLVDRFQIMAQTVQHRSEYIKNFAMHVSHEFKTPLASIKGTIELIQDHKTEMNEEQRDRFLEIIEKDTDRLKRLVERLLELARADVTDPSNDVSDLKIVLNDFIERYKARNLNFAIKSDVESSTVLMSREILETIFSNLFDNSFQHGATNIEIEISKNNELLKIIITDNGEGISESNTDKIFTPFFTTNRERGGTGLGMAIINSLVQAHYGKISLLPSEIGAKFELCLVNLDKERVNS